MKNTIQTLLALILLVGCQYQDDNVAVDDDSTVVHENSSARKSPGLPGANIFAERVSA